MSEKPTSAPTRAIELQVDVQATPAEVWRALTDPEELKRWFPPDARVTPGEGGSLSLSWGPGLEMQSRIETWDPPRRLRCVGGEAGMELAVEWQLEARNGTTSVRLVHSGFGLGEQWDDWYDGTRRGWTYFLANLRHYLEVHRGTPRALVSARRPQSRGKAEAWALLFGPEGLGLPAVPAAGQECALRWDGGTLAARVVAVEAPHIFAAELPELGRALLFVEMEGGPDPWHCGLWLSTYGLPPARVSALRATLDALADRTLGTA
jgi:uncharacterized protein YndB with AHSA1/START domain